MMGRPRNSPEVAAIRRKEHLERMKAYQKERLSTPEGRLKSRLTQKRWHDKEKATNPEYTERIRLKNRRLYLKLKNDPEYKEKRRLSRKKLYSAIKNDKARRKLAIAKQQAYYKKNREKILAYHREYYANFIKVKDESKNSTPR